MAGSLGPREKFQEYVLPHLDVLYRCAVRLTGTKADAEDLVQETCLHAFTAIGQLREPAKCRAWLFKILRNTSHRCRRGEPHRRAMHSLEEMETTFVDFRETLYDHYEHDPAYERLVGAEIRQAIAALPIRYREVLILVDIARFSYREMASMLEVPLGTVMSRLYRARRMLRASLREYAREQQPGQREP